MSKDEEKKLEENEEFISRGDINIEVFSVEEDGEPSVFVKFTNFVDEEDADEYAEFLATTLPLLLFESTRMQ